MILLSFVGVVFLPGLQRLYLGQKRWFWVYALLGVFSILPHPWLILKILWFGSYVIRLLCLAETLWLLSMTNEDFEARFNTESSRLDWRSNQRPRKKTAIASLYHEQELHKARKQGIIGDKEFQRHHMRVWKHHAAEADEARKEQLELQTRQAEAMEQLQQAKQHGLVTDQEFDLKMRELQGDN